MKNAVKLFLREWKYLLKRPRSLVLMVLILLCMSITNQFGDEEKEGVI